MTADLKDNSPSVRSRMEYLTELLNRASEAYYARDTEIMSNLEYDALYDELRALEEKTGLKWRAEKPFLSMSIYDLRQALRDMRGK